MPALAPPKAPDFSRGGRGDTFASWRRQYRSRWKDVQVVSAPGPRNSTAEVRVL